MKKVIISVLGQDRPGIIAAIAQEGIQTGAPIQGVLGVSTFKRIVSTAIKAQERGHSNLLSVLANANGIEKIFAPQELDGLVIFFPDPWIKKKSQAKNRLINESFSNKMYQLIRPGGFFWLKTDFQPYFESATEALNNAGFRPWQDPKGLPSKIYTSSFESQFKQKGQPTYEGVWIK